MKRRIAIAALLAATALQFPAFPESASAPGAADIEFARNTLEEILRIRTVKGFEQTESMANLLAAKFKAAGFDDSHIDIPTIEIDGETVAGIVVRYPGKAGSQKKPIALIAHMDVVDATSGWQTDPFVPVEKDGYLYARGSVDNKAGVALLTSTFIRLKEQGFEPDRDLIIAFSGDEETGMKSTRMLTAHPWVKGAEYALNADAGVGSVDAAGGNPSYSIQSAEKTFATFHITATNRGGHSASPRPDNALFDIADAIQAIRALRFPVGFNEISRQMAADLAASEGGEFASAINTLLETPDDKAARDALLASSVETHFLYTTCAPTMMSAGTAENALPQSAQLTVNCRILPGTSVASVQQTLVNAINNPDIQIELQGSPLESPVSPINAPLFASLLNALHAIHPGAPLKPSMSSGGTEGREYRSAGIPTYGAGALTLVRPDDFRAHGIDERVPLKSYDDQLVYWDVLLKDLAGGDMK